MPNYNFKGTKEEFDKWLWPEPEDGELREWIEMRQLKVRHLEDSQDFDE